MPPSIPQLLLVGARTDALAHLLPDDVAPIESRGDDDPDDLSPAAVLIGPDDKRPALSAQTLARRHPGAEMVVIAPVDRVRALAQQIAITPFVPLGVRVVSANEEQSVREALRVALDRAHLRRAHESRLAVAGQLLTASRPEPRAPGAGEPPSPAKRPQPPSSRPRMNPEDAEYLRAFWSAYEPHRAAVSAELRAALTADLVFGALIEAQTPEQIAARDARSAELQRAAIFEGRWDEYLDDLHEQGRTYANMGLEFRDWFEVLHVFRRLLVGRLVAVEGRARGALLGMDRFLDIAMAGIGEAYVGALRELQRAQRGRDALFADVVDQSADAILTQALDGIILSWNGGAERLYGYSASEVVGESIHVIVPVDRRDELARVHELLRHGERVRELETVRVARDGRRIDVSLTLSPLIGETDDVIGASAIARDITRRNRLQTQLRSSEARKAAVLAGALDAVITIDASGIIVEYNAAAERLFGYTSEEAVGQSLAELVIPRHLRGDHEAGLARFLRTGESRWAGQRLELPALNKSGEEFPAEVSIIRLAETDPVLFTGFIRDISELQVARLALERRAQELARSNADLEQFAYIASHDLKEPLRMVACYTELLAEDYRGKLDARADKYIHYAVDGARRMHQLLSDLLRYSRVGTGEHKRQLVDLGSVVHETQLNLDVLIREHDAEIICGELPTIPGDAVQLVQVFQNLIANAIKFRGAEPIRVEIGARGEADGWHLWIRDNGMGFEPGYSERIFAVFTRLHGPGEYDGSGIGLAIAKKIVESHGGRIWAESSPGAGSTFHVRLPATK